VENGKAYVSGDWTVMEGRATDFVESWTAFTRWSLDSARGAERFLLLRDEADPLHFLSLGIWKDSGSVSAWRKGSTFGEMLGRCRAFCDEFRARDYALASEVPSTGSG
jgi:heme-degrading monooxygenase HmoA